MEIIVLVLDMAPSHCKIKSDQVTFQEKFLNLKMYEWENNAINSETTYNNCHIPLNIYFKLVKLET